MLINRMHHTTTYIPVPKEALVSLCTLKGATVGFGETTCIKMTVHDAFSKEN